MSDFSPVDAEVPLADGVSEKGVLVFAYLTVPRSGSSSAQLIIRYTCRTGLVEIFTCNFFIDDKNVKKLFFLIMM